MLRQSCAFCLGLILSLSLSQSARAAADVWDANGASPPNGIWGTGANWVDNSTPTSADTAAFNIANTYTVTVNAAPSAIQALTTSAGNVTLTSSGGAKTLNVNSGGLLDFTVNGGATMSLGTSSNPLHVNVADDLVVNGNGTLNIRNGSQVTTVDLALGNTSGASGSIIVDGTGSALNRTAPGFTIGVGGGSAVLIYQNNATGNIDGTLNLFSNVFAGGSGAVIVESGADLEIDTANIGTTGNGSGGFGSMTVNGLGSTITQTGASALTVGRVTAGGNFGILSVDSSGVFNTGTGAVTVNTTGSVNVGGGTLNANGPIASLSGSVINVTSGTMNAASTFNPSGALNVSGGAVNVSGLTTLASTTNFALTGGVFNANAGFNNSANGAFQFNNGELKVSGGAFVPSPGSGLSLNGLTASDQPHLRLSTGSSQTTSGLIAIASTNKANLTLEGGADVSSSGLTIGVSAGSIGNVSVDGTGSTMSLGFSTLNVGNSGNGTLELSNGGWVNSVNLTNVAFGAGSVGTLVVDGGELQTLSMNLGNGGQGTLNINQGGFVVSGNTAIANNVGATGQATVGGSGGLATWNVEDLTVGINGTGTVNILNEGSVRVNDHLSINSLSAVNLDGGKLRIHTLTGADRVFYNSGTIALSGSRTAVDPLIFALYGTEIPANKGLEIEGSFVADGGLIVDGGSLDVWDGLSVGSQFPSVLQIINGGTVTSGAGAIGPNYPTFPNSEGHVLVSGAGSNWTTDQFLIVGSDLVVDPVDASSLIIQDQGVVDIGGSLIIGNESFVTLNGGTLRLDSLSRINNPFTGIPNGKFNFYTGTIQLIGDRAIGADPTINELFSGAVTAGKNLTVDGIATVSTSMAVDGGILTVGSLGNAQLLQLQRGTLHVLDGVLTVGDAGQLGATLDVNDDMIVNIEDGILNQGLVTGDGEIGGGTFTNAAAGELRAEPGKSLTLTGTSNTNAGQIKLLGGSLDFHNNLTNQAGAFISGNGSLLTGGLTNQGTMNFAGTTNIVGDVTNSASGRIISGGGGATIFFDDVINNGEIRTSTNGFSVFFGSVSGSGTFTGTGTVNFEGDLSPGNSPATVNFAGDVVLGPEATLAIELGGTTLGTYDRLDVAGDLVLDGFLAVSILPGFTPAAGQSFSILDWGTLDGEFFDLDLPELVGLTWDTSDLYDTGMLSLSAAGLMGDYNGNNVVDAADYTVWRDALTAGSSSLANDPTPGSVDESDFTYWRAHFGQSLGSGAGSAGASPSAVNVPEPSSLALAAACLAGLFAAFRSRRPMAA